MAIQLESIFDDVHLSSICGSLGSFQEDEKGDTVYVKDEECLEGLQDIMRYLRRDNPETREIFLQLGKWNLIKTDLLPIIRTYHGDFDLVMAATKLVVFLTLPLDPSSSNLAEQERLLQRSKAAFLEGETSAVIVSLVAEPLGRLEERGTLMESDVKLVQLIVTLFRNLICISDCTPTAASGNDHLTRLKDDLLKRFFDESVMEVLLLIAQDADRSFFVEDAPLLLEIFCE
eukprot:gene29077-36151_t